MELNAWTRSLRAVYDKAAKQYAAGKRGAETFFDEAETAFLASVGLRPINVYDYAEDFDSYGEPDWDTFLLVAAARRDYFLYEQGGVRSECEIDESELPPKDADLEGIVWLPRVVRKAECFLDGGLCHDIMYGCGGDRRFFKTNRVHPADFLRAVWGAKGDHGKILDFVKRGEGGQSL